ncbi:MAG: GNAT family N-acetyltransferase [Actinobacteria bacterium]|nr:GNAT family N-acetyltransferase [Actinomycetota bacterium]
MTRAVPVGPAFEQRHYDDPIVVELIDALQGEYVRRYGGPDDTPVDPRAFDPPAGVFLVLRLGTDVVAGGGWRRVEPPTTAESPERSLATAELKRMYVLTTARRRGLARALLIELERRATAAGIERIILHTGTEQPEAMSLYETTGYLPMTPFGPYADAPKSRFYAKRLTPAGIRPKRGS